MKVIGRTRSRENEYTENRKLNLRYKIRRNCITKLQICRRKQADKQKRNELNHVQEIEIKASIM